jgi:hypothetical protein
MAFDSYPGDDNVLVLTLLQSAERAITPPRFGPNMFVRIIQMPAANVAAATLILSVRADGGPMTEVPLNNPTLTDLPGPAGDIVANADFKDEQNGVYRLRVFPRDTANPPQQLALRLKNLDGETRSFRWVVADNDAESLQPRVALAPTTHLDAVFDRPVTGKIAVTNRGTGVLHVTTAEGTDLGSGFVLAAVPSSVPPNSVGTLLVTYTPPSLPSGVIAVASTTHRFTTDDTIAQRPDRRDSQVTITANVQAPLWQTGDVLVVDAEATDGRRDARSALIRVDPATGRQTAVSFDEYFVNPAGVALEASGHALVVDPSAAEGTGAIVRVDRFTGVLTVLSDGLREPNNLFRDPSAVVVTPQGRIVVADRSAFGTGGLIAVDPQTGVQTALTSAPVVQRSFNLAVDDPATGSLVVLCQNPNGFRRVVRVDPNGGSAVVLVADAPVDGIAVDETHRVLLIARPVGIGPTELVAYKPDGTRDVLAEDGDVVFGDPVRLRRDGAGNVWVTGPSRAAVGSIRLSDGEQNAVSSQALLRSPMDLVVVPPLAP